MFYVFISFCIIIDCIASILLKLWAVNPRPYLLVLGILGFASTGLFFALSMHYKGLAIANIFWIGMSAVVLTMAAYFLFKESLTTVDFIGIALVITGIILLN